MRFKNFLESTAGLHGLLLELVENLENVDLWCLAADEFDEINESNIADYFRKNVKILTSGETYMPWRERERQNKIILFKNIRKFDGYLVKDYNLHNIPIYDGYEKKDVLMLKKFPKDANFRILETDTYALTIDPPKEWFVCREGSDLLLSDNWQKINKNQIPFGIVLLYILHETVNRL